MIGRDVSMGVLEDFNKMLERIPIWKRLGEVPGEVDDLKSRVAALEEKLGGKRPPDVCKYCGAQAVRMTGNWGPDNQGRMQQNWTCGECKEQEVRLVSASR
jgi:hypothetical protein